MTLAPAALAGASAGASGKQRPLLLLLPNQGWETGGGLSGELWGHQLGKYVKCNPNTHTLSNATGDRRPLLRVLGVLGTTHVGRGPALSTRGLF